MSGSGSEKSASSFGLSKVITMDYKHEEETVLMQYGGGDPCPPGTSAAVRRLRIVHSLLKLSQVFNQVQSSVTSRVRQKHLLEKQTLTEHRLW